MTISSIINKTLLLGVVSLVMPVLQVQAAPKSELVMNVNQQAITYDATKRQIALPITFFLRGGTDQQLKSIVVAFVKNQPLTVPTQITDQLISDKALPKVEQLTLPEQVSTVYAETVFPVSLTLRSNHLEPLFPEIKVPPFLASGQYSIDITAIDQKGSVIAEDLEPLSFSLLGNGGAHILDGSLYVEGTANQVALPALGSIDVTPNAKFSISGEIINDAGTAITITPELASVKTPSSDDTAVIAVFPQTPITLTPNSQHSFTYLLPPHTLTVSAQAIRLRLLDPSSKLSVAGSHILPLAQIASNGPTTSKTRSVKATNNLPRVIASVLAGGLFILLSSVLIRRMRHSKTILSSIVVIIGSLFFFGAHAHAAGITISGSPGFDASSNTTYLGGAADGVVFVKVPYLYGFQYLAAGYDKNPCYDSRTSLVRFICISGNYAAFTLSSPSSSLIPCNSSATYLKNGYATTYPHTRGGFSTRINGVSYGNPNSQYGYSYGNTLVFCTKAGTFNLSGSETSWYSEYSKPISGGCTNPHTHESYCEDFGTDSVDVYSIAAGSSFTVNPGLPPATAPTITLTADATSISIGDTDTLRWATSNIPTTVTITSDASDNITATPPAAGSVAFTGVSTRVYTAHACNLAGCGDSLPLSISVNPPPTVALTGPHSVETGSGVPLYWNDSASTAYITLTGGTLNPATHYSINAATTTPAISAPTIFTATPYTAANVVGVSNTITVGISSPPLPTSPTVSLMAHLTSTGAGSSSVTTAKSGDPVFLSWSTSNTAVGDTLQISSLNTANCPSITNPALNGGVQSQNPTETCVYTATISNGTASNFSQVLITVPVIVALPLNTPTLVATNNNPAVGETISLTATENPNPQLKDLSIKQVADISGTELLSPLFSGISFGGYSIGTSPLFKPASGVTYYQAFAKDQFDNIKKSLVTTITAQSSAASVTTATPYFCNGN